MIYLDNAATTPCLPEVTDEMLPFFRKAFGNAASVDHIFGSLAKTAVDKARGQVAKLVDANPEDVIFTSGATEANNLVLNNTLRVITGTIEHPSVRDTAQASASRRSVEWLSASRLGVYAMDQLDDFLSGSPGDTLVSLMAVNNEIGSIQPLRRLADAAQRHGCFLHSDATQAAAYMDLSISGLDAMSLSAHKLYGPKGIGALICRSGLRKKLLPTLYGGGHERGLRSGTLNVPAIVGFGCAAALATRDRSIRHAKLAALRSSFEQSIRAGYNNTVTINAEGVAAPHICSVTLHGTNSRALANAVRSEVCLSLGSACATSKSEPSYVLLGIGLTEQSANETIRCSFSHELSEAEVVQAASMIYNRANALREFTAA